MSADSHIYPRNDELGMLGACLIGGTDIAIEVSSRVPVSAVFCDDIRELFAIVERLASLGAQCDQGAVSREWSRVMGAVRFPDSLIQASIDACPSALNASFFCDGILDAWRRRPQSSFGCPPKTPALRPQTPRGTSRA